jgi:predicted  nucleic acid-binding Zn-ribbon protein
MKKFLVFLLVAVVAIGALGYWRGWFTGVKEGTAPVPIQVNSTKFKEDKEAFSKEVGEKSKALKDKIANLMKNSEGLTGDDKTELAELKKKHDKLEKQLKELEDAGPDKFKDIKDDLSQSLKEVEQKIDELTKKLAKEKDK